MGYNPIQLPNEDQNAENLELEFMRKQVMVLNERLKEAEKHKSSFISNMMNLLMDRA